MKQKLTVAFLTLFLSTGNVFSQSNPDSLAGQILTPTAPLSPRINGAKVFGVRPNSPFFFYIPTTGVRPIKFSATNLPMGLQLDAETGIITGSIAEKGTYRVILKAKNAKGTAQRNFKIVVGETIALTPPMGWNSWNIFAGSVSADKVMRTADAMVNSGLINHGWSYVNIDDYWENNHTKTKDPKLQGDFRDAQGNILPNGRFPDMKGLADYIHSKGLKAGLYSSPGALTCGECVGSWQHEMQDATTFANWGFDFLKYDWCSYTKIASDSTQSVPVLSKNRINDSIARAYPYDVMGKALRAQKRDIVFSLCQYGKADVWKWGPKVNGTCWRISGDLVDAWDVNGLGTRRHKTVSEVGFNLDKCAPYSGPGHYNDPDMLVIGTVGWGKPRPTGLSPDEQYAHISLWCLYSAPLMLGCDLEKLDAFTLNLITNDEVLDIDQDPLAGAARRLASHDSLEIIKKPLEDGSIAVGLFNRGINKATITANWNDLAITGKQTVRDVWRQKDVAVSKDSYQAEVAPHGVVLIRLIPKK